MSKTKIILLIVVAIVAIAAVLIFVVLPNHFAPTQEELDAVQQINVDSLPFDDIPEEPVVP